MSKKKQREIIVHDGSELGGLLKTMIDEAGVTRSSIVQATGLVEAALSRQYNGKATTTLATLAKVGEAIGYRVIVRIEKTE
jgi:DNA-binding phage protein